jgi:cell division protein FtsB
MLSVTTVAVVRWSGGQTLTIGLLAVIVFALGSLLLAPGGIPNLLALRAERQRLGEQAVALLQQNAGLREQIQQLKTDDRFLEALARRELGMTRPDEVVYRFRRAPKGMTR